MRSLFALTAVALREFLHQKLLYGILVLATGFVLGALAVVHLTIGQWDRLLADMGIGATGIASSAIAIFFGAGVVADEIQRKSIYFVLSKPVGRSTFLVAKFLGLLAMIVLYASTMFVLVALVRAALGFPVTAQIAAAMLGGVLEASILAAAAVFFSSFTTSTLAAIFTSTVFVIGHLQGEVDFFSRKAGPALRAAGHVTRTVFPDFALLNFKSEAANALAVSGAQLVSAVLYAVSYCAIVLVLAAAIFRRRDFK